jgi:hypothetical protein
MKAVLDDDRNDGDLQIFGDVSELLYVNAILYYK